MNPPDKNFFPAALSAFREKLGITQKAAAERYGLSLSTWRSWERGAAGPTVNNDTFELLRDMFSEVPCVAVPEAVITPARELQVALDEFLKKSENTLSQPNDPE